MAPDQLDHQRHSVFLRAGVFEISRGKARRPAGFAAGPHAHELGEDDVGAHPLGEDLPHRAVGDSLHRRQQQGPLVFAPRQDHGGDAYQLFHHPPRRPRV